MLQLKPGQRMNVQDRKSACCVPATLTEIDEKKLTLYLHKAINLELGDEMELEVPQTEDAVYVLPGSFLEALTEDICRIEVQGEPSRRQRRRATRVPVNIKASYTVLSEKDHEERCSQGEILNISREGALISVNKPLKVNSELMLTFEVRRGTIKAFTTSIISEVVRAHENLTSGNHLYGVEFHRSFNFARA